MLPPSLEYLIVSIVRSEDHVIVILVSVFEDTFCVTVGVLAIDVKASEPDAEADPGRYEVEPDEQENENETVFLPSLPCLTVIPVLLTSVTVLLPL